MSTVFQIIDQIYLPYKDKKFDLHNDFDFSSINYSLVDQRLSLVFTPSNSSDFNFEKILVTFDQLSHFRFLPPKSSSSKQAAPDYFDTFGYWTDEEWTKKSIILLEPEQSPDPKWLKAIGFTSGALLIFKYQESSVNFL